MNLLYCASSNPGKLNEFRAASSHWGFTDVRIESLPGLAGIAPPEETGDSFEENAAAKAAYYSRYSNEFVFADDSGLSVDALNGAPGIHSARFAGPDATDAANNQLLLDKLNGVENRAARFVCVIAVARGGTTIRTFRGEVLGSILPAPQGSAGFGYDPLFFSLELNTGFGQASSAAKMSVSHRGKALRELLDWTRQQRVQLLK